MTHLFVTGDQRPEADWGEHVTDDEYNSPLISHSTGFGCHCRPRQAHTTGRLAM